MSILTQLQNPELRLSKSERKVASVVLEDPETAIHAPIATIARTAGVSEPTVNRFSRSLNCKGFPDFKVKLAQDLANGMPKMTRDVDPGDSTATLIDKIFESTHASLNATQAVINQQSVERAVDALAQARSILFFGLGASGPVAIDAQHKFFRFNTPVIAHVDMLSQRMISASLGQQDVVVCISYTGRTIAIVEAAQIARESGATVIGITSGNSSLAEQCSIVLTVDSPEDTDIYTPMTSRIAQLVLIDVLATAVALKRGPQFSNHLRRIKESLKETRYAK